jgi:hypothetical protein
MNSTVYPATASAAAVVSPTAAIFVVGGTVTLWPASTSTVVALVTTSQSNWPSCSS